MKVTLEKQSQVAAYAAVQTKPFMRVPGRLTIKYRYCMYEEACDGSTSVDMGYDWAIYLRLLSVVTGGNNYMDH